MIRKLLFTVLLAAIPAVGQAAPVGTLGLRVGFSVDPDQVVFGGQYTVADVAPRLYFVPNLELGLGDDLTIITVNLPLHYHFDTQTTWALYAGGGLAISFVSRDAPPPADDDSDTEVGGELIFGAEAPARGNGQFFTELKFGLGDIPDFKVLVGWNFLR